MTLHSLDETETKLTEEFGITQAEIEDLKRNIDNVTQTLFEEKDMEATGDVLQLTKQRFLSNILLTLNKSDWPPDENSEINAETPEEHFQEHFDELQDGGSPAQRSISFILGTLTNDVKKDHPIYQYAIKRTNKTGYGSVQ